MEPYAFQNFNRAPVSPFGTGFDLSQFSMGNPSSGGNPGSIAVNGQLEARLPNPQAAPRAPGIAPPVSGAGGGRTSFWGEGGKIEGFGSIASGLASLGQLYGAFKQMGLMRDQLDFTKSSYATNLANTTKDYNTNLDARTRSEYAAEGKSESLAEAYIAKHSL